jgi:hypothetical protein
MHPSFWKNRFACLLLLRRRLQSHFILAARGFLGKRIHIRLANRNLQAPFTDVQVEFRSVQFDPVFFKFVEDAKIDGTDQRTLPVDKGCAPEAEFEMESGIAELEEAHAGCGLFEDILQKIASFGWLLLEHAVYTCFVSAPLAKHIAAIPVKSIFVKAGVDTFSMSVSPRFPWIRAIS